ncbi:SGNH/GDSL hydrolase family protein [Streptomyces roseirectus]|uniref:SGNH/GDSL hydrolase family protein n=1 Tax=Streptomyces roseirectus TaxID=2768066 RepID=A0A7H0IJG0_9ACTN|nr:SGNH/GDSL hydrolase family protein [Streptomyces roseirectus]QNP72926.1 SGNH/GDSL hydrolase family protein [Streptomyces roseirectus]
MVTTRGRGVLAGMLAGVSLAVAGCTGGAGGGGGGPTAPSSTRAAAKPSPVWNARPASLAAVGDSITRGFDACGILRDCPEASWATGDSTEVDSLAVRLLGPAKAETHSWNYAKTGALMADLPGQMAQAGTRQPGLVTVMAGANDACRDSVTQMTPVSAFRTSFEQSMAALRSVSPKSQVYVASVPDLKRLWSEGRTSPLGRAVWKVGICPSMLADADVLDQAATTRRDSVQERVREYNAVLEEVCAKDPLCRFDDGAVYEFRFGTKQLSRWDWFHPSKSGQARLAEIAYAKVTEPGA